jgi:hypothetical protein
MIGTLPEKSHQFFITMSKSIPGIKWLNRIPFENPWITSLIASLIGSTVLVFLGFMLLLFGGGVPTGSFTTCLYTGSVGFVALFFLCFVACMLEFS